MVYGPRDFEKELQAGNPLCKPDGFSPRGLPYGLRNSTLPTQQNCTPSQYRDLNPPAWPSSQGPIAGVEFPSDQYILCYLDAEGNARCRPSNDLLLKPRHERDLCRAFLRVISDDQYGSNCSSSVDATPPGTSSTVSTPATGRSPSTCRKRRRSERREELPQTRAPTVLPRKSRVISVPVEDSPSDEDDEDDYGPVDVDPNAKLWLKAGDAEGIRTYVHDAFMAFQQKNCKNIAKVWIKMMQPNKQTKFPYKKKVAKSDQKLPGIPPYWWPEGIPHTEPDHLKKEWRVPFMVHIMCDRASYRPRYNELIAMGDKIQKADDPQSKRLREERDSLALILSLKSDDFLREAKRQDFPPATFICLEEILEACGRQEMCETGCIDADALFSVTSKDTLMSIVKEANRKTKERNQNPIAAVPQPTSISSRRRTRSPFPSPACHSDRETADFYPSPPKKSRSRRSNNSRKPDSTPSTTKHHSQNQRQAPLIENSIKPQPLPRFSHVVSSGFFPADEPSEQMRQPDYSDAIAGSVPYGYASGNSSGFFHFNGSFPPSQESRAALLNPQPQLSPTDTKWSPLPQSRYMSLDMGTHSLNAPHARPPSPPLEDQSFYCSMQSLSGLNESANTSFTSDYNSQPTFRTGSISHPNRRTGADSDYMMP